MVVKVDSGPRLDGLLAYIDEIVMSSESLIDILPLESQKGIMVGVIGSILQIKQTLLVKQEYNYDDLVAIRLVGESLADHLLGEVVFH